MFRNYRAANVVTADQDAVLKDAESLLTADLFGGQIDAARSAAVRAVHARVTTTLGETAARELFYTGGGPGSAAALPLLERALYTWRIERPSSMFNAAEFVAPSLLAWSCNCNTDGECSYHQRCQSPFACDSGSWGCGSWYLDPCTRLCSYDNT